MYCFAGLAGHHVGGAVIRCLRRSQVKFPLKGARPPTGRVSEPDRLPKALLEAVRFRPPPAYAPPACERARLRGRREGTCSTTTSVVLAGGCFAWLCMRRVVAAVCFAWI